MTVDPKMHQAMASLEAAAEALNSLAREDRDPVTRQTFEGLAEQVTEVYRSLQGRIAFLEQKEPLYEIRQPQ